jgi:hypothetical protein
LFKIRRVNLRLLGASSATRIQWIQLACTAQKIEVMGEHVRARRSKYQCPVHELVGGRGPGGQTFVLMTDRLPDFRGIFTPGSTQYNLQKCDAESPFLAEFIRFLDSPRNLCFVLLDFCMLPFVLYSGCPFSGPASIERCIFCLENWGVGVITNR